MKVTVKDGKARVTTSGSLDAEQVGEAIGQLFEAYAALTNQRDNDDGRPLIATEGAGFKVGELPGGKIMYLVDTPFGWVGTTIHVFQMLRLVGMLSTKSADLIDKYNVGRTVSTGAPTQ